MKTRISIIILCFFFKIGFGQWKYSEGPEFVHTQAISSNSQNVFMGTHAGIYKKETGGDWKKLENGLAPRLLVREIKTYNQEVFISGELLSKDLAYVNYYSSDGGESWKEVYRSSFSHTSAINSQGLYIRDYDPSGNSIFLTSKDRGLNWSKDSYFDTIRIYNRRIEATEDDLFVFSDRKFFHKELPFGDWRQKSLPASINYGNLVYVSKEVMFWKDMLSYDKGNSWERVDVDLRTLIEVDNKLYGSGGKNLYISEDLGASWDSIVQDTGFYGLAAVKDQLVGITFDLTLKFSEDRGSYWQKEKTGIPSGYIYPLRKVGDKLIGQISGSKISIKDLKNNKNDTIVNLPYKRGYIETFKNYIYVFGFKDSVKLSVDSGINWHTIIDLKTHPDLIYNHNDQLLIFKYKVSPSRSEYYISYDGINFEKKEDFIKIGNQERHVSFFKSQGDWLYAVSYNEVFKTKSLAGGWTKLNIPDLSWEYSPYHFGVDKETIMMLYIGGGSFTSDYVDYYSLDSGETWYKGNAQLPFDGGDVIQIHDLDIAAAKDSTIVFGSPIGDINRGIFISENGGLDWARFEKGLPTIESYSFLTVDSVLYNATSGAGIWQINTSELIVRAKSVLEPQEILKIYPNPSKGRFVVDAPFGRNIRGLLKVFDLTGQKIIEEKIEITKSKSIDLSGFSKGMYILQLTENEQITIGRLIIE